MSVLHMRIGPDHVAGSARTTYSRWQALTACGSTVASTTVTMKRAAVTCRRCLAKLNEQAGGV